jgi:uncharacterized membrane protein YgaE (UPF0421/DUF939 family)
MSYKNKKESSHEIRNWIIGMIIGIALSLAFTLTGNPGLIGVGAAIGTGLAIALNAKYYQ